MTITEVSKLTGISVRALHYYDEIGLLRPAAHSEAGYRLYHEADLDRLQQILFFRELKFPLNEISRILTDPQLDWKQVLREQVKLLELKKEHLENLINIANWSLLSGERIRNFTMFDSKKLDEYSRKAKERWGSSAAYKEFEEKSAHWGKGDAAKHEHEIMQFFAAFGSIKNGYPASPKAQELVTQLQRYITDHFYTCTDAILSGLGTMYAAGGDFTENIDKVGGEGTAAFASQAIQVHCSIAGSSTASPVGPLD